MNFFDTTKATEEKEIVEVLLNKENLRIEKILSMGQSTDWMIQEEEEWVLVAKGEGILELEKEEILLKEGDFYFIPKHLRHRVKETKKGEPTLWLAVFVPGSN